MLPHLPHLFHSPGGEDGGVEKHLRSPVYGISPAQGCSLEPQKELSVGIPRGLIDRAAVRSTVNIDILVSPDPVASRVVDVSVAVGVVPRLPLVLLIVRVLVSHRVGNENALAVVVANLD